MQLSIDLRTKLKNGAIAGVKKGWRSFIWICKIVIPVSFLVAVLQWTGWLDYLDFLLNPVMNLINLPAEAALPILTGMLVNLYACIAIVTVLPFTIEQMTLIAIFNMIAHGLIMEGIVQHQSGLNVFKATAVRLIAAIVTVLIVSQFLGDTSQPIGAVAGTVVRVPFLEALKSWGLGMRDLLLKILLIIIFIMVLLECLQALDWMKHVLRFSSPLVRVIGLSRRTVLMWVAGTTFGLLFGGAVMAEESKKGVLTKDELERVHIFAGINHAMIEDPAYFAAMGLNPFWLWMPRFVMAVVAVQSYNGFNRLKRMLRRNTIARPQ
ncbi:MAG: iron transporter [Chloroflexi bacterium]|nr:iron transporter [Chloroflexota bacterium]